MRAVIDRPGLDGFKWRVWWVAASGFFTTSYSIFATNVISPALSYVYPECVYGSESSKALNLTTLAGTIFGMLVFGFLADRYGRKSVYGLELTLVVIATIGMTSATAGVMVPSSDDSMPTIGNNYSMNPYGWVGFWRVLLGFGLGAEVSTKHHPLYMSKHDADCKKQYPLSAVIAAEWSSTRSRGTMMASVFLMQSLGQLAAYAFGLIILLGIGQSWELDKEENQTWERAAPAIDIVWRLTIGIGAIPALVSLFLRRIIPETPMYLAAQGKVADAAEAAIQVYAPESTVQPTDRHDVDAATSNGTMQGLKRPNQNICTSISNYLGRAKEYLSEKGRWRALLGVMITWWLLDLAYYGLAMDNPRTISTIWMYKEPVSSSLTNESIPYNTSNVYFGHGSCATAPDWLVDPANPDIGIYEMLKQDSIRNLLIVSTGTVTGSVILLFSINYVPRVTWMGWMFVALAGLFAINGGTFFTTFETNAHALTMTLYVLAQVIFNLGPNTITFILPAELFGTRFRAMFYGLAASSGKLGAITIQLIVGYEIFGDTSWTSNKTGFAVLLLGFCPAMLLGAFVSWVWIPEVQYPRGRAVVLEEGDDDYSDNASDDGNDRAAYRQSFRQQLKLPNRPLEEIDRNPDDGQVLGMRRNLARLFRFKGYRQRSAEPAHLMQEVERGEREDDAALRQRYGAPAESDLGDGYDFRQDRY